MTQPGEYTFVPWFRQGAAASITVPDDPDAALPIGRVGIPADLTVGFTAMDGAAGAPVTVSRTVELVGPGDVRDLKPNAILRRYPADGTADAVPGEFAYVEFYEEDLPWRYTPAAPARPTVGGLEVPQLRPWLALFVLADGEFELTPRTAATPVLTVASTTPLPPYRQAWAWAHAQLSTVATADQAGRAAIANPDAALSRLLSPRRLVAGTSYTAFLVPAFETGRRAGLGAELAGVPAQRPSWGVGEPTRRFPIYHSWRFSTAVSGGSFESYVRGLVARPAGDEFGSRQVDTTGVGGGLDDAPLSDTMQVEGALQPPGFARTAFPDYPARPAMQRLQELLDAGMLWLRAGAQVPADPEVVPPVYAGRHAGVLTLGEIDPDPSAEAAWVRELNLDPRQRAVAGIGTQVVRDQQDDLMRRAWLQVGELRDANQRLREGQLAVAASAAVFAKHLAGAGQDGAVLLTAAANHGVPAPVPPGIVATAPLSVRAAVEHSAVPSATQDAVFTTVTRPGRRFVRVVTDRAEVTGFQNGALLDRMNTADVTAAPAMPPPTTSVAVADIIAAATAAAATMQHKQFEPKRVFWQRLAEAAGALVSRGQTISLATLPGETTLKLTAWTAANPGHGAEATAVTDLINAITAVDASDPGDVAVTLPAAVFTAAFGKIAGKGGNGVTVVSDNPPANSRRSRFADDDTASGFATDAGTLGTDLVDRMGREEPPAPPLPSVDGTGATMLAALHPDTALAGRIAAALPGLTDKLAAQAAIRARRLAPVLAYPSFDDPMFAELARIDRDLVLPNLDQLPAETITLMQTNSRFVESYLAGLNTEMGRELLWREYPTDQRGSYFRVFWDRRDALAGLVPQDVSELPSWTGPLGSHVHTASAPIVLVVRSALLRKFPHLVVYAQRATGSPGARTLATSTPLYPMFTGGLDPDVALFGFDLDVSAAKGSGTDPGWFFVLQERPGQLRFGLDLTAPVGGFHSWDDLWWGQLTDSDDHLDVSAAAGLQPADPSPGIWGATSADMAAILFRSPVMYARHASDLLP